MIFDGRHASYLHFRADRLDCQRDACDQARAADGHHDRINIRILLVHANVCQHMHAPCVYYQIARRDRIVGAMAQARQGKTCQSYCVCLRTYIHAYVHVACIFAYIYVYTCIYFYLHIHTSYIHIHIHTYTHTHTHIYTYITCSRISRPMVPAPAMMAGSSYPLMYCRLCACMVLMSEPISGHLLHGLLHLDNLAQAASYLLAQRNAGINKHWKNRLECDLSTTAFF
jgi:hypothetical protein